MAKTIFWRSWRCLATSVFGVYIIGIYALVFFVPDFANSGSQLIERTIYPLNGNLKSENTRFWIQQGSIHTDSNEENNSLGLRSNGTRTPGVDDKLSFLSNNNTGTIQESGIVKGIHTHNDEIVYDDFIQMKEVRRIHDISYKKPTREDCQKRLPKCIMIGIFKCGTRELYDFMGMHPNIVYRKGVQEFIFFASKQYRPEDMTGSLEWLRDKMPCSYSDQITVMEHPEYFTSKYIPKRLYTYDRDLKMILLVREPVQRLISHVWFQNRTTTNLDTYMDSRVLNSSSGEIRSTERVVNLSVYDEPMVRYLKYFDLNQILIIEAKELQKDPVSVLHRVERFLGLRHVITEDYFVYNEQKGFYCIQSPERKAICYSKIRGRKYNMDIFPETKQKLLNYYKPHNERFFKLIGHRYDW